MAFEDLKGKISVGLFALCMCITFIFLVTSTPISQFKGKGMNENGASVLSCITAWGLKNTCGLNNYQFTPSSFACSKPKQLFQATQAFYIISVVVSCLCCVLSAIQFAGTQLKPALFTLGALNIAFSLIPWAIMTAVWYQDYCGNEGVSISSTTGKAENIPTGKLLRDNFTTSAGYGLTIAAWCINIIGLILLAAVKA